MNNQTTSSASAKLFARKGTARPVGPGTFEDQAENDNEEAPPPVSSESASGDSNTAASLSTIDFKRRTAADAAILAAIGSASEAEAPAVEEPAASAAAQPQKAFQSLRQIPPSLVLVLLVSISIGVGIWYVFHQKSLMQDRRVDATPPTSSEPAGIAAEPQQAAGNESMPGKLPASSDSPGTAKPEASSVVPSFDLIRIEPNGEAVIAGRAPPDSNLILLDNGKPIGTVTADWAGEWAFVPDRPLAPGNHEFSLVIITPQGTVTVPAVVKPDKGAALAPAGSPAAEAQIGGGGFVVQLSSTTTMKGANQELSKIQKNFGDLLGSKKLSVHKAKLDQGSVRYRVRSDAFAELETAREFCAAFRAQRQECLVVKR